MIQKMDKSKFKIEIQKSLNFYSWKVIKLFSTRTHGPSVNLNRHPKIIEYYNELNNVYLMYQVLKIK